MQQDVKKRYFRLSILPRPLDVPIQLRKLALHKATRAISSLSAKHRYLFFLGESHITIDELAAVQWTKDTQRLGSLGDSLYVSHPFEQSPFAKTLRFVAE
jgi:hypothetical protein